MPLIANAYSQKRLGFGRAYRRGAIPKRAGGLEPRKGIHLKNL